MSFGTINYAIVLKSVDANVFVRGKHILQRDYGSARTFDSIEVMQQKPTPSSGRRQLMSISALPAELVHEDDCS